MNFEEFKQKYQKVEVKEHPNRVLESIKDPALSVILITYQHVNYIRDAIEGILKQKTNFPFEIIIGDDESTDGTREICIEYSERYPDKIRLFLHDRANNIKVLGKPCLIFQFIYNCYNLRAKYIAGVSGDDYWTDPTKLQKQYDFLKDNPDYSMCYHKWIIVDGNENRPGNKNTNNEPHRRALGKTPRGLSIMFKNIYNNIPYQFAEVLAEDTFTKFILSTLGKKKFISNIEPAVYREHTGGIWSLTSRKFKYDNDVLSATKILEAYRGTRYQTKLESMLLARLVTRKLYLIKLDNKGLVKILFAFCKELSNHEIKLFFPFGIDVSGFKISAYFVYRLFLIKMNEFKWKFKYLINL